MKNIKLSVRKAKKSDSYFLFKTYNDGVKKKKFINNHYVNFKNHKIWLKNTLKNKNYIIFITSIKNKKKIGYVRFERVKLKTWEVSIANSNFFQGKGYGTLSLANTLNKFKKKVKIYSIVKKDNKQSLNCFLKNSFKIKKNHIYLKKKKISMTKFHLLEFSN